MDFEVTDDQVALTEGIAHLLSGRAVPERIRGLADVPGAVDRDLWQDLADAGVFGIHIPEDSGGVGLGFADAVLVFEQLGRALVPGPLVATLLAAASVDGAVTGDTVVGVIDVADRPLVVEHLDALDALVVLGESVSLVDAAAVTSAGRPRPLDPLTPVDRLAAVPDSGPLDGDVVAWRMRGAVLTSALLLGLAGAALDLGVAYAKQREQFGRPIGSFQAVKHMLADGVARAEVARAAVYAAGVVLDDAAAGDEARATAAAKITAAEAAVENAKACIQVHGGMGYTWQVDAHLILKRALVLETAFGSVDHHAEVSAAALGA